MGQELVRHHPSHRMIPSGVGCIYTVCISSKSVIANFIMCSLDAPCQKVCDIGICVALIQEFHGCFFMLCRDRNGPRHTSHRCGTDIVIQCLEDGHIATGQCSLLRFDARLSACGIAHQSSGFYKLSDCCCIGRCIGTDIAFLIVVIQSCTIILVEIALKEIYNIKVLAIVKQHTEHISSKGVYVRELRHRTCCRTINLFVRILLMQLCINVI